MKVLELAPMSRAEGIVRLPGSKSISNRVLLLSALASGATVVRELLEADDTRVMLDALAQLGVRCEPAGADAVRVQGCPASVPTWSSAMQEQRSGR
jgi:3-phosphoshikimate 1-carboxyvinyltransferase